MTDERIVVMFLEGRTEPLQMIVTAEQAEDFKQHCIDHFNAHGQRGWRLFGDLFLSMGKLEAFYVKEAPPKPVPPQPQEEDRGEEVSV